MNPNDMPGDEMYLEYAPTSPGSNDGNQDVAMHIKTIQRRFRQCQYAKQPCTSNAQTALKMPRGAEQ